jgi:RES domain-containing protein
LAAGVDKREVLNFTWAGRDPSNRWNVVGEPTLYIAGDIGVAIAEWTRHFRVNITPELARQTVERTVYRLNVTVDRALDLRDSALWEELHLADAPHCFLTLDVARVTAQFLRRTTDAQALLVPCMAMLDDPDRWNLVLFLEKLPPDPTRFITGVEAEGPFRWR